MKDVFDYLKSYYNDNVFEQNLFLLYCYVTTYEKNETKCQRKDNPPIDFLTTFISYYKKLYDYYCYTKIKLDTKHKIMIINIIRKVTMITKCRDEYIKLNTNNITSILTNEYIQYIYNLYSQIINVNNKS